MNTSSDLSTLELVRRDNLVAILPQNTPGALAALLDDQIAEVFEKPREIARIGDMAIRRRAKPANSADFRFLTVPVVHKFWRGQIQVEPVEQAADFTHLPEAAQIGTFIPDVEGRGKDTLVTPSIRIGDGRFKSYIHEVYLRKPQTLLRNLLTEFGCADRVRRVRSVFSQWCVRRKTYQSRWFMMRNNFTAADISSSQHMRLKRFVPIMETVS